MARRCFTRPAMVAWPRMVSATTVHSPAALLKHMDEDGVELGRFFRRVTSTVLSTTNPQQEPFMYGRLPDEDFYFKSPQ